MFSECISQLFNTEKENPMEIERKYLIQKEQIPLNPSDYPCRHIEQGYLCTRPVVRVRRDNDNYYLTYKSKGLMVREEYNLPLDAAAYGHLKTKIDGRLIIKERYVIPLGDTVETSPSREEAYMQGFQTASPNSPTLPTNAGLSIELDFFKGDYEGLVLAEVEFPDEASANAFCPPAWFGEDVTYSTKYHNSTMSRK